MTLKWSAKGTSSKRPTAPAPALFTHTSMRLKSATARSRRRLMSSCWETSVGTARALTPDAPHWRARSSRSSSRRAANTTDAPSLANFNAAPFPKPLDAPVITTTLPVRLRSSIELPPFSWFEDDFDTFILLVEKHVVGLRRVIQAHPVGDDETRVDFAFFDALQ